MAKLVVQGAVLTCTMGAAPSALGVAVPHMVDADASSAASVDDFAPNVNIASFGMCQSMSNPQVQAATSAAQGVLTPQPCVPVTSEPWSPGSQTVSIGGRPALHDQCTCACQWAGTISITNAGQQEVDVD